MSSRAWVLLGLLCLGAPRGALAEDPPSDHAAVVGRVGVGWFGVSEIPLGGLDDNIVAPAIGVRWWFAESVGLDLGLGVAVTIDDSSTTRTGNPSLSRGGPRLGVLFHVGVPIALYARRHYTFLLVPELNVGAAYATSEDTPLVMEGAPPTPNEASGSRLDAGGRVGAEIHFGFIGLPELALEASVGLFFSRRSASATSANGTQSASVIELSTTSFNDPWDFFRSAVAARYYF